MGQPRQSPPSFPPDSGDIPEVIRDQPLSSPAPTFPLPWAIAGLGTLGLVALVLLWGLTSRKPEPVAVTPSPEPTPTATTPAIDNVLGHLPYTEAPAAELKGITPDGRLKLRKPAADSFLKMQAAARSQGVSLVPISGFRTVDQQNQLFFEIKAQRNQEARQRAEVSAPPGYSEHHTGYAVDIGDGSAAQTHLQKSFAETKAFQWLEKNAAKYSFELSFPPNNPQGVAYEPWHWRYVGDRQSLELFYRARQLPQTP